MPCCLSINRRLGRLVSISFAWLILSSDVAWAANFGPLRGSSEIGQPLKLQAELSSLDGVSQGQLRSTCMSAHFLPMHGEQSGGFENGVLPLSVDFVSDGKQGGQVRFRSSEAVREPVGTITLRSECPLAVFEVSWSVLLDPSRDDREPAPPLRGKTLQADAGLRDFNFDSSSALGRSMKPSMWASSGKPLPKLADMDQADSRQDVKKQSAKGESVAALSSPAPALSQVPSAPNPVSEPPQAPQVVLDVKRDEPDELAALDQKLMDVNLIQSGKAGDAPSDGAMSRLPLESVDRGVQLHDIPVVIGACSLLVLLGISGFWLYRQRVSVGRVQKSKSSLVMHKGSVRSAPQLQEELAPRWDESPVVSDALAEGDEQADEPVDNAPNHLVLNSFLGADHDSEAFSASAFDHDASRQAGLVLTGYQQSLSSALGLVNRADSTLWKLPESYSKLVTGRNTALSLSANSQSRLLRTQIGLVELAYQEAIRHRALEVEAMDEFVQTMLKGVDLAELEVDQNFVPDVIHSYLSAKFCEVSGAQAKSTLKANCLALASIAEHWPVCFASSTWAALVDESSVGV